MATTLTGVGFEVTLLVDADQAVMKRAILDFGRRLREGDSVGLFYYAGHGVQIDGENFLIPVGADIRDTEEVALNGVSLSELLKTMERSESRLNIAILDACRDNPFASPSRSASRGLAPVTAPSGTLIAYATAPGQVALDGAGVDSPYTAALAEAIPTEGSPLEDVFRRARRKVLEVTGGRQTPWEHSSLTGEFFFKPKSAPAEPTVRNEDSDTRQELARLAEIAEWNRIKSTTDAALLRAYMEKYPEGFFRELAALRLGKIKSETAAWNPIVTGSTGAKEEIPDAAALYEMAVKLDAADAAAADLEKAAGLYRRAAESGLAAAMFGIGRAYDKGRGVTRDLDEATRWYRAAAERDYAPAMASLGTMYEFGEGVPRDLAEAFRFYKLGAERGDPGAMASLGFLYAEGKGVARHAPEARRWYVRAAEQGQTRAMFNLALMYIRGDGGPPNLAEAARLLKAAADKGHVGALRELACLYDEGRGVARNPGLAADYLLMAYKAGNSQARVDVLERPDTWSYGTRREIQRRLARRGLYAGHAHGFFDAATRKALARYAENG